MSSRNKSIQTKKTKTPAQPLPTPLLQLPVVCRCSDAYELAYQTALAAGRSEDAAEETAKRFYRGAMPAPIDLESTRDFIACVTFGVLADLFPLKEATALYYGAQVALSVNRNTAGSKNPNRRRKA